MTKDFSNSNRQLMLASIIAACLLAVAMGMAQEGNVRRGKATPRTLGGTELYRLTSAASVEVLVAGKLEGSGWFADANGLVITAAHAVWGRDEKIELSSPLIGRVEAKVIAVDRGHDIALLQAPPRKEPYPALELAEAMPEPTAEIYLRGAAQFRHGLLLTGRLARLDPAYEYLPEQKCYVRIFHVAAAAPKGTSGGCWVNAQGRVIGNQSGYMTNNSHWNGIANIAPMDAIRRLITTRQTAHTPDFGAGVEELWEQSPDFIAKFPPKTEGIVTVVPHPDGSVAKAGLNKESVIIAADGKPIRLRDQLLDHVRARKPDDEITLQVLQPNDPKKREVKVKLAWLEKKP